ncbi:hypothetical protein L1987_44399 [Smallanthus sonchifolius]|uniref:Uncharacterized protein n=1 Tax=Smallanthus sonchifolius TaxID=185202 RepID=A0ACB9GQD8_9ASTR|nr:hypothetical protein L1987_44399 [Smallanthus sonchifolius]
MVKDVILKLEESLLIDPKKHDALWKKHLRLQISADQSRLERFSCFVLSYAFLIHLPMNGSILDMFYL